MRAVIAKMLLEDSAQAQLGEAFLWLKGVASTSMKDATAKADTVHGMLIAPNLVAANHDRCFNFRIDFDVDQPINHFSMMDIVPAKLDPPMKRNAYIEYSVWNPVYDLKQRYAGGKFAMQSDGSDTLAEWVKKDRSLIGKDIVTCFSAGFRHIPHMEDWPVMSMEWKTVSITPDNFFAHNPALTIRNPKQKRKARPLVRALLIPPAASRRRPSGSAPTRSDGYARHG